MKLWQSKLNQVIELQNVLSTGKQYMVGAPVSAFTAAALAAASSSCAEAT